MDCINMQLREEEKFTVPAQKFLKSGFGDAVLKSKSESIFRLKIHSTINLFLVASYEGTPPQPR